MDELQNECTKLNKVLKTLAQQPNEPTDHLLDYSEKPCRMQDAGISQVVENNSTTCHSKIFPISYLSRFRPDPEGVGLGGYPINLLFRTDNKNVHVRKNVNVNRRLVCEKFVAKIAKRVTASSLSANNEV